MRIPKYSRHSSGQARVRIGGQTFYLGPYGSKESKAEYNRLVGEFIATGGVAISADAKDDLSLCEMFAAYLGWAKRNYGKQATEFTKAKLIIRRANKRYRDTEASSFGYRQFEAVRQSMIDEGLTRGYINESTDRLVRIFKWAASRGLIAPTVPQALGMIERLKKRRTTAPDNPGIRPVASDVVEATLPFVGDIVADMIRFQSVVGCRPGEVCKIKPNMVDRSGDVWEIRLEEHKTEHHGKTRTLYVGPKGQSILAPYLLRSADQHCFRPVDSERKRREIATAARKTPLSCGNRTGTNRKKKPKRTPRECFHKDSYRKAIHAGCDKAFPAPAPLGRQDGESDRARWRRLTSEQANQLKAWQSEHRWNPNQLRHSFGTEVRRTEGIEVASILLGHSDVEVTKIYAESDRQKAIEVARRVG